MPQDVYDKVIMLAKRRGFIYPSFEIYGGVAGLYDYGPLGSQLKNNLENLWRYFYIYKDSCLEINTPTITLYDVLEASGHVDEFTDLTVDCEDCKLSFKVEDIIEDESSIQQAIKDETLICPTCGGKLINPHPVNLMFATKIGIGKTRDAFLRPETAQGIFTGFHLLYRYAREKLPFGVIQLGKGYRNEVSPRQGPIRMREFSMAEAEVFFDPNNKSHKNFSEVKDHILYLYDNESEFQLTMEDAVSKGVINNQALSYYMYLTQTILIQGGVDPKKFRFRKHADDELAHYAEECWDAELFSERFGWVECVGIADRSAYDINAHIEASKTDMYAMRRYESPKIVKHKKIVPKMNILGPKLKDKAGDIKAIIDEMEVTGQIENLTIPFEGEEYLIPKDAYDVVEVEEKEAGEKFIPHVIEPSYGIDRILYCILEHNYKEIEKENESYHLLSLPYQMAPIKTGVFPLIKDESLTCISEKIDKTLREHGISTSYDETGTIGRRYARMDEIGTPFCITVDHDTLDDKKVTMRNRDTREQERIDIDALPDFFKKQK
ncbi:glycine--tRNA ligase [Thermoplasmatales archaeon ex4572_165]|nr:MAG: glycine--tRNA ligase [Thermoplasmatales archaeon ex4572_165]RLF59769.1 MAG: glycine--tRNA ligase [Thermoplasmata archaeon]